MAWPITPADKGNKESGIGNGNPPKQFSTVVCPDTDRLHGSVDESDEDIIDYG